MKLAKIKNRIKSVVMASALGLALLAGFPAVEDRRLQEVSIPVPLTEVIPIRLQAR